MKHILEGFDLKDPSPHVLEYWQRLVAETEVEAAELLCGVVIVTQARRWTVETSSEVPLGVVLRLGDEQHG